MRRMLLTALASAVAIGGCNRQDGPSFRSALPPASAAADKEGDWTILLMAVKDAAEHARRAEDYRKRIGEQLGWKGLFTINKASHSELYWGRYLTPARARKNLLTAKAHTTPTGTKPFARAMIMPLPGEDIGPPDWNLKNARGEYTYLVAVFKDDPERKYIGRKKFAVNYCQRLREGEYEGYFYHGVADSWVTIGTFGAEAVREEMTPTGRIVEIQNARMKAIRDDFPHLAINGTGVNELAWDPVNRKMIRIPQKTRPIHIPRGK